MEVETSNAVEAAPEADASITVEEPDFDPMEPERSATITYYCSLMMSMDEKADAVDRGRESSSGAPMSTSSTPTTPSTVRSTSRLTKETKRKRRQKRFATAAEKASAERVRKDPVLTDTEECDDKDFVFVRDSYSKATHVGKRWTLHKDWRDRGRARINADCGEKMFPKIPPGMPPMCPDNADWKLIDIVEKAPKRLSGPEVED